MSSWPAGARAPTASGLNPRAEAPAAARTGRATRRPLDPSRPRRSVRGPPRTRPPGRPRPARTGPRIRRRPSDRWATRGVRGAPGGPGTADRASASPRSSRREACEAATAAPLDTGRPRSARRSVRSTGRSSGMVGRSRIISPGGAFGNRGDDEDQGRSVLRAGSGGGWRMARISDFRGLVSLVPRAFEIGDPCHLSSRKVTNRSTLTVKTPTPAVGGRSGSVGCRRGDGEGSAQVGL